MAAIVEGMQAEVGTDAAEVVAAPAPQAGVGQAVVDADSAFRGRQMSLNSVLGTLAVALVTAMFGVLMWQVDSLGDRIDANGARIESNGARIDRLGTEFRAEFGSVRGDMAELETGLRGDMAELETGLRGDMAELETGLRADMADLETGLREEFRAEIGGLRAEMQAGFREINAILLDHTDRLARLEAAAGLPRPSD